MTDLNNAVLLIGYNDSMITYVKPDTGEKVSVPYEELEALTVLPLDTVNASSTSYGTETITKVSGFKKVNMI